MTTKRNLKNEIEELKSSTDAGEGPVVITLTHVHHKEGKWPDMSDSPHPELTTRPWPDAKPQSLHIATPSLLPEKFRHRSIVVIETCETSTNYRTDPDDDTSNRVTACEMWDTLTDEQLREEKQFREANNDPIPDLLSEI